MSSLGTATLDITLDKKSIATQFLDSIATAQKEVNSKQITYHIGANEKDLQALKAKIEQLRPDVKAGITINFSTDQFENKLKDLNKYVGKEAKKIGEDFAKNISSVIPKNISEQKLAESIYGKGTKKKYAGIIQDLNKQVDLNFDVNKVTSLDELQSYTVLLEKLTLSLNKIGDKKVTGVNTEKLKNIASSQLEIIYKNAGTIIEAKTPQWIAEIQSLASIDFSNIQKLINEIENGLKVGTGNGGFVQKVNKDTEELIKTLQNAEQESQKLHKELDSIDKTKLNAQKIKIGKVATKFDTTFNKPEALALQKEFQTYVNMGGQLSDLSNESKRLYEQTAMVLSKSEFIPLDKITGLSDKIALVDKQILDYKTHLIELQNIQQTVDSPSSTTSGNTNVDNQTGEIQRLQQLLDEHKATIQEITDKYIVQNNVVAELEKKLEILGEIQDPKVLESTEYKSLISNLQSVTEEAQKTKTELQEAEKTIELLYEKLNLYANGDVVDRVSYEKADKYISCLEKQVDKFKTSLQQAKNEASKFEESMYDTERQLESSVNENTQQQSIIDSQKEQIDNLQQINAELEKTKKEYDEILIKLEEIEQRRTPIRATIESADAYNNAVKNSFYNRFPDKAPEGFVSFDFLEQIKKKMLEVGNEQEKLIKMAVYYNSYVKTGGTEKIIDQSGNDISDKLLQIYKDLSKLTNKQGLISSRVNPAELLNELNQESFTLNTQLETLQSKQRALQEELTLQKQINAELTKNQDIEKNTEASNSNKVSKEQFTKLMLESSKKKRQTKSKATTTPNEQTPTSSNLPNNAIVTDNTKIIEAENQALVGLKGTVDTVTTSVDNKTAAFQREEQVVVGVVQRELSELELLDGQIFSIIQDIDKLSNINISVKINGAENGQLLDENSVNALESLKEKLNDFHTESLSSLSVVLQELKISTENVDNLQKLSNVILTLKDNLNNLSSSGVDFLTKIENIVGKTAELKNLTNVLQSTATQIKAVAEKTNINSKSSTLSKNRMENLRNDFITSANKSNFNFDADSLTVNKNGIISFTSTVKTLGKEAVITQYKLNDFYNTALNKDKTLNKRNLNKSTTVVSAKDLLVKDILKAERQAYAENARRDREQEKIKQIQQKREIEEYSEQAKHIQQVNTAQEKYERDLITTRKKDEAQYTNWFQKEIDKRAAIQQKREKEEFDVKTKHTKESKDAQIKYEQELITQKKKDNVEYVQWWEQELDRISAIQQKRDKETWDANNKNVGKNYVSDFDKAYDDATQFNTVLSGIQNNFNSIANGKDFDMTVPLSNASKELSKLNNQFYNGKITLEEYKLQAQGLTNGLTNVIGNSSSLDNANAQIKAYVSNLAKGDIELKQMANSNKGIAKITATFENQDGKLQEIIFDYNQLDKSIKQVKTTTQANIGWLDKFMSGLKGKATDLLRYLMTFASFYQIINIIRKGITVIKELDTALTEMRKVSDESIASLKEFQKESFNVAKTLGTTAVAIQNSAADFMRLGYSLKEASELAKDANIYANVGDMEIDEATEHMISSIKAWGSEFKTEVEASKNIIDVYNEVGKLLPKHMETYGVYTLLMTISVKRWGHLRPRKDFIFDYLD